GRAEIVRLLHVDVAVERRVEARARIDAPRGDAVLVLIAVTAGVAREHLAAGCDLVVDLGSIDASAGEFAVVAELGNQVDGRVASVHEGQAPRDRAGLGLILRDVTLVSGRVTVAVPVAVAIAVAVAISVAITVTIAIAIAITVPVAGRLGRLVGDRVPFDATESQERDHQAERSAAWRMQVMDRHGPVDAARRQPITSRGVSLSRAGSATRPPRPDRWCPRPGGRARARG